MGRHTKMAHGELPETNLQPSKLTQAQVVMAWGSSDCAVYFVKQGSLTAHREDSTGNGHGT